MCLSTVCYLDVVIIDANYRRSFFGVIRLFGPTILAVVMARHRERDTRLHNEADRVIDACIADLEAPISNRRKSLIRLKTKIELQTTLCTEYRYVLSINAPQKPIPGIHVLDTRDSYFNVINLIGVEIFDFVLDPHAQRDGVGERDGARIDDMIERIRHAAD